MQKGSLCEDEAETGVMWPQTKKCKEQPGIGGGRAQLETLEAFEESISLTLQFRTRVSRTLRKEVSVVLSQCVVLCWQP